MNRTAQGNQGVIIHWLGQARFLRRRGTDGAERYQQNQRR
jgi:hypothetical protein